MRGRQKSSSAGFTLLELLTAVAVLALLLSVAAPSFTAFAANQRVRSTSFDLTSDLILARSEALKRAANVRILPNSGDWQNGWSVIVLDSALQLNRRNAVGHKVEITDAPASITFDRNGRVDGVMGVVRLGIESQVEESPQLRCIHLDPTGRPRTVKESCP
jgi:type IV fimbrial biogenesis protein FimT